MKRKIILTTILLTSLTIPANADLQVSATDTALGATCYSEEDGTTKYSQTVLFKIVGPKGFFDNSYTVDKCPTSFSTWNDSPESACWISISADQSTIYSCSTVITDGTEIGSIGNYASVWTDAFFDNTTWTPVDQHRAILPDGYNETSTGDYTSRIELTGEYGCDTGYYTTDNNPHKNSICTPCPPVGTFSGLSEIGNTSITGCYLPSGTYTDETGTFTLSGRCHYKQ